MDTQQGKSFAILRVIAERTRRFSFPNLRRPPIPPNKPATQELVSWGAQVYCFSWMRHLSTLVNGIITLKDAGNMPSARIVARSAFELGAHAYYVKKHLKQHLDSKNVEAAWNFLTPISAGSRYIDEWHPEESEMFPPPSHISKVVNCFGEVMPSANEGYSFLSELCHPNMLAFSQYYHWPDPFEVQFVDHDTQGVFGTTAAASVRGLLAIEELLRLAEEDRLLHCLHELLVAISKQSGGPVGD
jgi:hypothetical protein